MKKTKVALAVTALVFGLTACVPAPAPNPPAGGGESSPASDGGGAVTSPGSETQGGGAVTSPGSETQGGGTQTDSGGDTSGGGEATDEAKFGDTYRFEDGLQITIGKPTAPVFENKYEEERAGNNVVAIAVTIKNDTGESFEPNKMSMKMVSDGVEASTFYGSNYRYPSATVRAGKTFKFNQAFEVENKKDLELEVSFWDQLHDTVFFVQE